MPRTPRVVFFGTPDFAVASLEALKREVDVVLVVSQPDRPVGRGRKLAPPPVKAAAEAMGLEVIQPKVVKGRRFAERIAALEPDFLVTAAFGRIMGPSLLATPKKAPLNVHASLLPRHRGAAPANWAILDGDKETGVSIMKMVVELDAGPVYKTVSTSIRDDENSGELLMRLAPLGAKALLETITRFDEMKPESQDDSLATYAGMLQKKDGRIDWSKGAVSLCNHIRGMSPWPSAFTELNGKALKVHAARVVAPHGRENEPGAVIALTDDGIDVACGEGLLRLKELQLAGKKRLDAARFLVGNKVPIGTLLGTGLAG